MSVEAKFRTPPFTLLSIGSRIGRVVTFGKKSCYLLLASLKFVTFVRTLTVGDVEARVVLSQ